MSPNWRANWDDPWISALTSEAVSDTKIRIRGIFVGSPMKAPAPHIHQITPINGQQDGEVFDRHDEESFETDTSSCRPSPTGRLHCCSEQSLHASPAGIRPADSIVTSSYRPAAQARRDGTSLRSVSSISLRLPLTRRVLTSRVHLRPRCGPSVPRPRRSMRGRCVGTRPIYPDGAGVARSRERHSGVWCQSE